MGFNLLTNLKTCYDIIQDTVPVSMVYYSHIPSAIVSLLIGTFVILKNRKMVGWLVFFIAVFFSLWSFTDVILWTSSNSESYMFYWSIIVIFEAVLFMLNIYLVKVFSEGKDVSFWNKITWLFLLLPIFIMVPTRLNMSHFDVVNCEPINNFLYDHYALPLYGFFLIWFIVVIVAEIKKGTTEKKKQIKLLSLGSFFFLFVFFVSNLVTSYLIDNSIMSVENSYKIEMYGLFSMPVFLGILAYIIVKFKAFDVKLIGAQALVYGLVILIGSQFFFIESNTNRILNGITFILAVGFGIFLIKSVKEEVRRKEELQHMTEQLAVANDELRKLDNAKSEFISIASHQLRTPLTSIKGYVSLVLEGTYGEIAPYLTDPLSKIYASNERLIQLVEDLLNVSRIESGRMEFMFGKFKVENAIKDLYDTFSVIAKGKGLYLHLDLPQNPLPEIEADGSKTREVISNLIDNALKYTKRGGVTVKAEFLNNQTWNVAHLGGKAETMNGDIVKISISDTGMGVPDTELPYLFSKFSRGKDTSRLHVTGTGLGLYVGKNIIEAQHGRIYVESEGSGKGSKFIIELPVVQPKNA